jgi:hypothetical protein
MHSRYASLGAGGERKAPGDARSSSASPRNRSTLSAPRRAEAPRARPFVGACFPHRRGGVKTNTVRARGQHPERLPAATLEPAEATRSVAR